MHHPIHEKTQDLDPKKKPKTTIGLADKRQSSWQHSCWRIFYNFKEHIPYNIGEAKATELLYIITINLGMDSFTCYFLNYNLAISSIIMIWLWLYNTTLHNREVLSTMWFLVLRGPMNRHFFINSLLVFLFRCNNTHYHSFLIKKNIYIIISW